MNPVKPATADELRRLGDLAAEKKTFIGREAAAHLYHSAACEYRRTGELQLAEACCRRAADVLERLADLIAEHDYKRREATR